MKRTTPAAELELGDNGRYLTDLGHMSFAMSLHNSRILVEIPKAICGYLVTAKACRKSNQPILKSPPVETEGLVLLDF